MQNNQVADVTQHFYSVHFLCQEVGIEEFSREIEVHLIHNFALISDLEISLDQRINGA